MTRKTVHTQPPQRKQSRRQRRGLCTGCGRSAQVRAVDAARKRRTAPSRAADAARKRTARQSVGIDDVNSFSEMPLSALAGRFQGWGGAKIERLRAWGVALTHCADHVIQATSWLFACSTERKSGSPALAPWAHILLRPRGPIMHKCSHYEDGTPALGLGPLELLTYFVKCFGRSPRSLNMLLCSPAFYPAPYSENRVPPFPPHPQPSFVACVSTQTSETRRPTPNKRSELKHVGS